MQCSSDHFSSLTFHASRALRLLSTLPVLTLVFGGGTTSSRAGTLAFDSAGNVFAVQKHAVCKFAADGTQNTFASGFKSPIALCLDNKGNLFVSDYQEQRIYRVTPDGKKSIFLNGITTGGMAFDRLDNFFVTQAEGYILKFTPDGKKSIFASGIDNLGSPMDLALDRNGNVFVSPVRALDQKGSIPSAIIKLTADGTRTVFASPLNEPAGISLDASDNLFVTEATEDKGTGYLRRTIVEFNTDGTKNTFASGLPGRPPSLACSSSGDVFVSTEDSILVFNSKGTQRIFASDRLSPDKQWEYQADEIGAEIDNVGTDEMVLNLGAQVNGYEYNSANILWAPDSKRFAFNYLLPASHALYETIALYQLRDGKWEALSSPVNTNSKDSQLKQLTKGQKLPKGSRGLNESNDVLKVIKWIDSDTALLSAGSPKAMLLFTLKIDAKGNSKITKVQPVSDEELDEMDD